MTILIVDSKKATRVLLRTSLRDLGYTDVIEAHGADEALRLLSQHRINLVISEMGRELSGLDLLRAVRNHPSHGAIPFIIVTSRVEGSLVRQAKEAGVTGYLARPFALGVLKQRIDSVLSQRHD